MSEGSAPNTMAGTERWRMALLAVVGLLGGAVLIALIATLGASNAQRDRALRLQSHSYEVMILARSLSGTIARSEASLGRYVISGDKTLGRQYSDQWVRAGGQIDTLARATRDNDAQQKSVAVLRAAYRERGAALGETALSTYYGKNAQALARYYAARKGESLLRINAGLDAIIARERALLDARTAAANATVAQSNSVAKVLAIFGMLIVLAAVALGWMTVQALGERASARADADAERERSHELEAAVAAATAELHLEARERADAEAKLRQGQKMEAVGQLTGGIAHDFNNMLAVVLGGLELARRKLRDGEARRHIDNAMEGAHRAAALTKRLLAFARAEPLLPEAIAPGALIAGMCDLLDRTLGDAVTVRTVDRGADWHIWVDKHQLENALLNLAVNARDAMDGRGRLTFSTGRVTLREGEIGGCQAGDHALIAVSDTGCGITPEVLERVFEPFFTTKPVGQGTGLGLSQIFAFVHQSHGEIAIASQPGKGTTVTLYLPRHVAAAAAIPEATASEDGGDVRSLDILVVEDDPRVLAATLETLIELGHRATGCSDPLSAATALQAMGPVDLIVSDVLMPGQTGPEMIADLTARGIAPAVLFMTGYAGEVDSGGFDGRVVLRKPFTIAALDHAIGEAIAERRADDQEIAAE
ncbi:hypothetical protein BH09PSE4_BH09PSE4_01170 [soil metagenome]